VRNCPDPLELALLVAAVLRSVLVVAVELRSVLVADGLVAVPEPEVCASTGEAASAETSAVAIRRDDCFIAFTLLCLTAPGPSPGPGSCQTKQQAVGSAWPCGGRRLETQIVLTVVSPTWV